MRLSTTRRIVLSAALLVLVAGVRPAFAGAIISHGAVRLGVNDLGHLDLIVGQSQEAVGIDLGGVGDGLNLDCLCEGWGVGVVLMNSDEVPGGASEGLPLPGFNIDNANNLDLESFTSDGSTTSAGTFAESVATIADGADLRVTHRYEGIYADGAGGALFRATVTFENTGTGDYSRLLYRRVMDWDIPPTGHDEFVTIYGNGAANLIATNDQLNDSVDPFRPSDGDIAGCGENVDFVDCPEEALPGGNAGAAADHGAHFDFDFGTLAAGQSRTFELYFGATYSEAQAYSALVSVGAEVFSLGQSNTVGGPELGTPGTWIFAATGVGGTPFNPDETAPVPEPASLLMFGTGLTGLAAAARRRRAAARARV